MTTYIGFDRVHETSTSSGTGSFTLAGATTGSQSFSAAYGSSGNAFYYCIVGQTGSQWEVGGGQYISGSNLLERDVVLSGSNGTSKVNFTAGVVYDCFITLPAVACNLLSQAPSVNTFLAGVTSGPGVPPSFRSLIAADLPHPLTSLATTQSANTVFAGPTTGSAAAATFRAIVGADVPTALSVDQLTPTSSTLFVTPAVQQNHPSACKAWVSFGVAATVLSIKASYGVTSVVRNSTGDFTITWSTAFTTRDYAVTGMCNNSNDGLLFVVGSNNDTTGQTTTTFHIQTYTGGIALADPKRCFVSAFGN